MTVQTISYRGIIKEILLQLLSWKLYACQIFCLKVRIWILCLLLPFKCINDWFKSIDNYIFVVFWCKNVNFAHVFCLNPSMEIRWILTKLHAINKEFIIIIPITLLILTVGTWQSRHCFSLKKKTWHNLLFLKQEIIILINSCFRRKCWNIVQAIISCIYKWTYTHGKKVLQYRIEIQINKTLFIFFVI